MTEYINYLIVGYTINIKTKEILKMSVIEITKANFEEEVINSDKPVLLDFWAVWCPPCKRLSPLVDLIAEENPQIKVGKVNTDEEQELAMKFSISSIPTLIFFKSGKVITTSVGEISKPEIMKIITQ